MNEKITKKEIIAFALIVGAMIASLIYGYFMLKSNQVDVPMEGQMTKECMRIWNEMGEAYAEKLGC